MLRLQLLSKNSERECPMVRFIKLIACFRLLGAHTLGGGTPNKHILGAWWKACVVSGV